MSVNKGPADAAHLHFVLRMNAFRPCNDLETVAGIVDAWKSEYPSECNGFVYESHLAYEAGVLSTAISIVRALRWKFKNGFKKHDKSDE